MLRLAIVPYYFVSMTFITCHPNCVFTGFDNSPVFSVNAAISNSLTICPLPNQPRSPPDLADGHVLFALAISPKSFPCLTSKSIPSASCSVFTSMWAACTLDTMAVDFVISFIFLLNDCLICEWSD